jgi:hypothetical protein
VSESICCINSLSFQFSLKSLMSNFKRIKPNPRTPRCSKKPWCLKRERIQDLGRVRKRKFPLSSLSQVSSQEGKQMSECICCRISNFQGIILTIELQVGLINPSTSREREKTSISEDLRESKREEMCTLLS